MLDVQLLVSSTHSNICINLERSSTCIGIMMDFSLLTTHNSNYIRNTMFDPMCENVTSVMSLSWKLRCVSVLRLLSYIHKPEYP